MENLNASPLRFIGTGSAFNEALGNNSAYMKRGSTLLLLDCGGTVCHKIQKLNLLEGVQNIYVVITHTHPDHIGSLGDLIFYTYYMLNTKTTVIYPNINTLEALLGYMGVTKEFYKLQPIENKYMLQNNDIAVELEAVSQKHTNTLDSYGYLITLDAITLFYSGDAYCIPEQVLKDFQSGIIKYLYQDTCSYDIPGIPHMPLNKLTEQIEETLRPSVYCMHLDKSFDAVKARDLGFNVALAD